MLGETRHPQENCEAPAQVSRTMEELQAWCSQAQLGRATAVLIWQWSCSEWALGLRPPEGHFFDPVAWFKAFQLLSPPHTRLSEQAWDLAKAATPQAQRVGTETPCIA